MNITNTDWNKIIDNSSEYLNLTMMTITPEVIQHTVHPNIGVNTNLKSYFRLAVIIFYIIGIIGNASALIILRMKRHVKNTKYIYMLKCLAANNLVALIGMLMQLMLHLTLKHLIQPEYEKLFCIGRVICRYFGLCSGSIAGVMAVERWYALSKPFTYHKHVTFKVIQRTILSLLFVSAIITFLPFIGIGLYYDAEKHRCARYRDATELKDIIYAYIFCIFGICLCGGIVVCNLIVTRLLYYIGKSNTNKMLDARRQTITLNRSSSSPVLKRNLSITSVDEIRFAKLMIFLSITFVLCWMPQMISVVLAQLHLQQRPDHWFFRIADFMLAVHFTVDPYIYVLLRNGGKSSGGQRSASTSSRKSNQKNGTHFIVRDLKVPINGTHRQLSSEYTDESDHVY